MTDIDPEIHTVNADHLISENREGESNKDLRSENFEAQQKKKQKKGVVVVMEGGLLQLRRSPISWSSELSGRTRSENQQRLFGA